MTELLASWKSTHTWVTLGVFLFLIAWETLQPYMRLFRDRKQRRLFHGVKNVTIAILNNFMVSVAFFALWVAASAWATKNDFGILNWLQLGGWKHALGAVLLMDFWTYWWHRINHVLPFFWRFHQVHHSDPEMDTTTAFRFHFGEICFSSIFRTLLIPLFGMHIWELVVYELFMFSVVQFHHANISVPARLDALLRLFIATPYMHKIHHSTTPSDFNSNYSSFLSLWDRLFGSFRMHDKIHDIRFGLDGQESAYEQAIGSLMNRPFR